MRKQRERQRQTETERDRGRGGNGPRDTDRQTDKHTKRVMTRICTNVHKVGQAQEFWGVENKRKENKKHLAAEEQI